MRARVTANTAVANPCAGEIMTSLAAHHDEDEGKVKKLKRAAEDAALAVRALGGVKAAQLRRHELRLAGSVVRALGREGYATVATVALLPVLGLPERLHPTEPQLRAAFAVFDTAGRGDAGPADVMWSKLERLLPEGTTAEEGEEEDEGGGAAAAERRSASLATLALKDSPLTFEPFCRMCARLRGLLRHLDHGGGALKPNPNPDPDPNPNPNPNPNPIPHQARSRAKIAARSWEASSRWCAAAGRPAPEPDPTIDPNPNPKR